MATTKKLQVLQKPFLRFLVVGGFSFFFSLSIIYVCTEFLKIHYLVSTIISLYTSSGLSFYFNNRWTFKSNAGTFWTKLVRYYAVNFSSFIVNLLILSFLVSILHIPYLLASVIVAIVMLLANFTMHKNWSFAKTKPE